MSGLNILVVGASVAGPTAAYWLARAGARVTVIERFPQLRKNGQNIDIRTTGVTIMRKTPGMEAAVRAKVLPIDGICVVDSNDHVFASMKATGNPDQQSLVSEYEIFRGDLSQILVDLTKDNENVKYIFDEQVASIQQSEEGPIKVEFTNGTPASNFDLVVACDGSASRTRAIGLGCAVRDHITSINCWASYFTTAHDMLKGSKTGRGYSAVGGRFFTVGPDPNGGSKVFLLDVNARHDKDATKELYEASKHSDTALKQCVAKRFKGAGWRSDELLQAMMESKDFYGSEMVQVKVPSLFRGRFALVGDAGYAPGPTGTGTTLAITGAYLLAGEICKHKGDLDAGLRGYEERMRPIVNDMQKIPPGVPNLMAPQTALGLRLRNLILIVICGIMSFGSRFAWIWNYLASGFGTDKYGIPDYDWVA